MQIPLTTTAHDGGSLSRQSLGTVKLVTVLLKFSFACMSNCCTFPLYSSFTHFSAIFIMYTFLLYSACPLFSCTRSTPISHTDWIKELCVANLTSLIISVAPVLDCPDYVRVPIDTKDLNIECVVRSEPVCDRIAWTLDRSDGSNVTLDPYDNPKLGRFLGLHQTGGKWFYFYTFLIP